ncbi:28S ribosomal protein S31, mitochondrial [Leptopilina boulardi]|uniref:28S ribosomal protein S31, mitochondrial n=1 Tax=Leptopilina boulardi TaxID=63433 RepID=UPI0021F5A98E|nr:28S ribosomal protein S31, mitochondrial [Leptopilina boulardi]XP_051173206.1 28S ribosomal protein S31, mitochondrial [Leptopilina boulardi]
MLINRILTLKVIPRKVVSYSEITRQQLHTAIKLHLSISSSSSDSSDSSSDSDNEQKSKLRFSSKSVNYLKGQNNDDNFNEFKKSSDEKKLSKIDVAIPKKPPRPQKNINSPHSEELKFEENFANAAKKVAENLGGDIKKIESDLLNRLLKPSETNDSSESSEDISDILKGMKVDNSYNFQRNKLQRVRAASTKIDNLNVEFKGESINRRYRDLKGEQMNETNVQLERMSIFNGQTKKFGILKIPTDESQVSELTTWSHLEKREFKLLECTPPTNYFQEMIQWTNEGKIWHFPIDNDQGIVEEKKVHFSEHVFMERHLKGWCPKHGPIRQFMELVCVGLSKNAFMTVDEKIQHIMWYKDYFGDKRELLKELGALDNENPSVLPIPTNKIDLGPHY